MSLFSNGYCKRIIFHLGNLTLTFVGNEFRFSLMTSSIPFLIKSNSISGNPESSLGRKRKRLVSGRSSGSSKTEQLHLVKLINLNEKRSSIYYVINRYSVFLCFVRQENFFVVIIARILGFVTNKKTICYCHKMINPFNVVHDVTSFEDDPIKNNSLIKDLFCCADYLTLAPPLVPSLELVLLRQSCPYERTSKPINIHQRIHR